MLNIIYLKSHYYPGSALNNLPGNAFHVDSAVIPEACNIENVAIYTPVILFIMSFNFPIMYCNISPKLPKTLYKPEKLFITVFRI